MARLPEYDVDDALDAGEARDDGAGFADAVAVPDRWTAEHAGRRLVEAMATLDRLPRVKGPRQAGNHWVPHRVEWADLLAQAELPPGEKRERDERRNSLALRPSGLELDRMDAALEWVRDLRRHDAGMALVLSLWAWRTAKRRSVRALCREKGWAPTTVYMLRARALAQIASTLNNQGRPVY